MPLDVRQIEFPAEETERRLIQHVDDALRPTMEAHRQREELYARWRRKYKAIPEQEKKTFPWPGASNIVVPLIGMTVDALVARFTRAMLGTKDFCEVEIKSPAWERLEVPDPETPGMTKKLNLEKEIRDWINHFVKVSGTRDRLRSIWHDCALLGDAFGKPIWVEEERLYHGYDESGSVTQMPVPGYVGVRWTVPAPDDIIPPRGFDSWEDLPYLVHRLRYTWDELQRLANSEAGYRNIDVLGQAHLQQQRQLKKTDAKERDDLRHVEVTETSHLGTVGPAEIFELFEVEGRFPIETFDPDGGNPSTTWEHCILTYSMDFRLFVRTIYNPWFGKARHLIRIPFLILPHELYSMGVAEQCEQFQEEASTCHNQVIDAGTVANAPLIVASPNANISNEQEVWPGKVIITDEPSKDVQAIHLGSNSAILGSMEEKAVRYTEARTGISSYHLGMESSIVGSQATATGTTALIGEGNLRFWMSIDDIRSALEEMIYITIQLEQQMRPEGYEWAPGRFIQFPQGDVRTSIGLQLFLTSEKINKDIEIQNLMLLMQTLEMYYMRLLQASALLQNPTLPPAHKLVIIQVMEASMNITKRFVERFDIENIDEVVPDLMRTINSAMQVVNGLQGILGPTNPLLPAGAPQVPPGGAGSNQQSPADPGLPA